jgi:UDP-2,3-diacylglucosamine pyrophosphatase LpxH
MRFLKRGKKAKKIILVISDLHLGAGLVINGSKNSLEDFHADEELVSFLEYHSTGEYAGVEVELIINGDFLDLLAVPYVPYFDDEYWSESAALEKLELILKAHPEVMEALNKFVSQKNKKVLYIIGNHDAEFVFESLRERFLQCFDESHRERVTLTDEIETYNPAPGVYLKHGHQYEQAHIFDMKNSVIESKKGEKYFLPPWGSYYVTHVINRYKQERYHMNAVRPISNFLIHGLIFDTFFTMRFMFANFYYFLMVRFLNFYRQKLGWKKITEHIINELTLFQDFETLTRNFFQEEENARVLIVGHTHEPVYREFIDGSIFVNTGTWMEMVSLDLSHQNKDSQLTYARVDLLETDYELKDFKENVTVALNCWAPQTNLPYYDFR